MEKIKTEEAMQNQLRYISDIIETTKVTLKESVNYYLSKKIVLWIKIFMCNILNSKQKTKSELKCILIHASNIIIGFTGYGNIHGIKVMLDAGIRATADWFPFIICYQIYNSFESLF